MKNGAVTHPYHWQCPEGLEEYVRPTYYADSDSHEIQHALPTILNSVTTPRDAAVRIYDFVRDQVKFATADIGLRASQTLRVRKGPSLLKGNLAIAMFRGASIPARYRLIDADERKVRGIVDDTSYFLFPLFRRLSPRQTVLHIIPQVYLNATWLDADPLFDKEFFDGLKRMGVEAVTKLDSIDWNGTDNLSPQEFFIRKELGTYANADDTIRQYSKHIRYLYYVGMYYLFDRHILRTRRSGKENRQSR